MDADTIDRIPLVGLGEAREKVKFLLGRLVPYRHKTVDEVIRESVHAYYNRCSFNDPNDVAQLLQSLGINDGADLGGRKIKDFYPQLGALMKRRHQIVHHADLIEDLSAGLRTLNPIQAGEVEEWLRSVTRFLVNVISHVSIALDLKLGNALEDLES